MMTHRFKINVGATLAWVKPLHIQKDIDHIWHY